MSGAYTVAELLKIGALGLVVVLAVALTTAGTVVRPERRRRFLLWAMAGYMALWTLWVLYNTVLLTRYLWKVIR